MSEEEPEVTGVHEEEPEVTYVDDESSPSNRYVTSAAEEDERMDIDDTEDETSEVSQKGYDVTESDDEKPSESNLAALRRFRPARDLGKTDDVIIPVDISHPIEENCLKSDDSSVEENSPSHNEHPDYDVEELNRNHEPSMTILESEESSHEESESAGKQIRHSSASDEEKRNKCVEKDKGQLEVPSNELKTNQEETNENKEDAAFNTYGDNLVEIRTNNYGRNENEEYTSYLKLDDTIVEMQIKQESFQTEKDASCVNNEDIPIEHLTNLEKMIKKVDDASCKSYEETPFETQVKEEREQMNKLKPNLVEQLNNDDKNQEDKRTTGNKNEEDECIVNTCSMELDVETCHGQLTTEEPVEQENRNSKQSDVDSENEHHANPLAVFSEKTSASMSLGSEKPSSDADLAGSCLSFSSNDVSSDVCNYAACDSVTITKDVGIGNTNFEADIERHSIEYEVLEDEHKLTTTDSNKSQQPSKSRCGNNPLSVGEMEEALMELEEPNLNDEQTDALSDDLFLDQEEVNKESSVNEGSRPQQKKNSSPRRGSLRGEKLNHKHNLENEESLSVEDDTEINKNTHIQISRNKQAVLNLAVNIPDNDFLKEKALSSSLLNHGCTKIPYVLLTRTDVEETKRLDEIVYDTVSDSEEEKDPFPFLGNFIEKDGGQASISQEMIEETQEILSINPQKSLELELDEKNAITTSMLDKESPRHSCIDLREDCNATMIEPSSTSSCSIHIFDQTTYMKGESSSSIYEMNSTGSPSIQILDGMEAVKGVDCDTVFQDEPSCSKPSKPPGRSTVTVLGDAFDALLCSTSHPFDEEYSDDYLPETEFSPETINTSSSIQNEGFVQESQVQSTPMAYYEMAQPEQKDIPAPTMDCVDQEETVSYADQRIIKQESDPALALAKNSACTQASNSCNVHQTESSVPLLRNHSSFSSEGNSKLNIKRRRNRPFGRFVKIKEMKEVAENSRLSSHVQEVSEQHSTEGHISKDASTSTTDLTDSIPLVFYWKNSEIVENNNVEIQSKTEAQVNVGANRIRTTRNKFDTTPIYLSSSQNTETTSQVFEPVEFEGTNVSEAKLFQKVKRHPAAEDDVANQLVFSNNQQYPDHVLGQDDVKITRDSSSFEMIPRDETANGFNDQKREKIRKKEVIPMIKKPYNFSEHMKSIREFIDKSYKVKPDNANVYKYPPNLLNSRWVNQRKDSHIFGRLDDPYFGVMKSENGCYSLNGANNQRLQDQITTNTFSEEKCDEKTFEDEQSLRNRNNGEDMTRRETSRRFFISENSDVHEKEITNSIIVHGISEQDDNFRLSAYIRKDSDTHVYKLKESSYDLSENEVLLRRRLRMFYPHQNPVFVFDKVKSEEDASFLESEDRQLFIQREHRLPIVTDKYGIFMKNTFPMEELANQLRTTTQQNENDQPEDKPDVSHAYENKLNNKDITNEYERQSKYITDVQERNDFLVNYNTINPKFNKPDLYKKASGQRSTEEGTLELETAFIENNTPDTNSYKDDLGGNKRKFCSGFTAEEKITKFKCEDNSPRAGTSQRGAADRSPRIVEVVNNPSRSAESEDQRMQNKSSHVSSKNRNIKTHETLKINRQDEKRAAIRKFAQILDIPKPYYSANNIPHNTNLISHYSPMESANIEKYERKAVVFMKDKQLIPDKNHQNLRDGSFVKSQQIPCSYGTEKSYSSESILIKKRSSSSSPLTEQNKNVSDSNNTSEEPLEVNSPSLTRNSNKFEELCHSERKRSSENYNRKMETNLDIGTGMQSIAFGMVSEYKSVPRLNKRRERNLATTTKEKMESEDQFSNIEGKLLTNKRRKPNDEESGVYSNKRSRTCAGLLALACDDTDRNEPAVSDSDEPVEHTDLTEPVDQASLVRVRNWFGFLDNNSKESTETVRKHLFKDVGHTDDSDWNMLSSPSPSPPPSSPLFNTNPYNLFTYSRCVGDLKEWRDLSIRSSKGMRSSNTNRENDSNSSNEDGTIRSSPKELGNTTPSDSDDDFTLSSEKRGKRKRVSKLRRGKTRFPSNASSHNKHSLNSGGNSRIYSSVRVNGRESSNTAAGAGGDVTTRVTRSWTKTRGIASVDNGGKVTKSRPGCSSWR